MLRTSSVLRANTLSRRKIKNNPDVFAGPAESATYPRAGVSSHAKDTPEAIERSGTAGATRGAVAVGWGGRLAVA